MLGTSCSAIFYKSRGEESNWMAYNGDIISRKNGKDKLNVWELDWLDGEMGDRGKKGERMYLTFYITV